MVTCPLVQGCLTSHKVSSPSSARSQHIVEMSEKVESKIADVTQEQFEKDENLSDIAAYRLQITGEATTKLSEDIKGEHPYSPWIEIAGVRHVLTS